MPVQPMKSIAAVALAANLSLPQIMAAGCFVSVTTILLAITNSLSLFNLYLPLPLVRGIQLGTGLQLINKGVASILSSNKWDVGNVKNGGITDNFIIAILAFIFSLTCYPLSSNKSKITHNPAALILFLYGLVVSVAMVLAIMQPRPSNINHWGPSFLNYIVVPSWSDFKTGIWVAGLGQLPLTLLNSVSTFLFSFVGCCVVKSGSFLGYRNIEISRRPIPRKETTRGLREIRGSLCRSHEHCRNVVWRSAVLSRRMYTNLPLPS
jgi:multisubunit Na+/H+ antiporter MnhB subunit